MVRLIPTYIHTHTYMCKRVRVRASACRCQGAVASTTAIAAAALTMPCCRTRMKLWSNWNHLPPVISSGCHSKSNSDSITSSSSSGRGRGRGSRRLRACRKTCRGSLNMYVLCRAAAGWSGWGLSWGLGLEVWSGFDGLWHSIKAHFVALLICLKY